MDLNWGPFCWNHKGITARPVLIGQKFCLDLLKSETLSSLNCAGNTRTCCLTYTQEESGKGDVKWFKAQNQSREQKSCISNNSRMKETNKSSKNPEGRGAFSALMSPSNSHISRWESATQVRVCALRGAGRRRQSASLRLKSDPDERSGSTWCLGRRNTLSLFTNTFPLQRNWGQHGGKRAGRQINISQSVHDHRCNPGVLPEDGGGIMQALQAASSHMFTSDLIPNSRLQQPAGFPRSGSQKKTIGAVSGLKNQKKCSDPFMTACDCQ